MNYLARTDLVAVPRENHSARQGVCQLRTGSSRCTRLALAGPRRYRGRSRTIGAGAATHQGARQNPRERDANQIARPTAKSAKTTLSGPGRTARGRRRRIQLRDRSPGKQTLARARAAAMAREVADTALPRFKVDSRRRPGPHDLLRRLPPSSTTPRPTRCCGKRTRRVSAPSRSITKVMTATVFPRTQSRHRAQSVTRVARRRLRRRRPRHLRVNDQVTVDDLLHLLLIASGQRRRARAGARLAALRSEGFMRTDERRRQ